MQSEIVQSEIVPSEWSALLALQRATHATLQVLAAELVDLDLTASEINALANLADGRGRTVSELGAAVGTRPTTLTSVLDRLERRGHITRGTRPGDRRAVLIELTASGRLAAATIRQAVTDLERRALGRLPADAIAGLRTALQALTEVPS
ncbi:MarR family winged helix-turn-helix transcriptional regulator [Kitasatospora sp. NPDC056138]|uniref:MarR family winged helix-turn-helix transcriptional regulator n=1 Tax=Kitasatospora sp. NPDC056138 TaxID=3345724 RepID=UPI0035D736B8